MFLLTLIFNFFQVHNDDRERVLQRQPSGPAARVEAETTSARTVRRQAAQHRSGQEQHRKDSETDPETQLGKSGRSFFRGQVAGRRLELQVLQHQIRR